MKLEPDHKRRRPLVTRRMLLLLLTLGGCDFSLDWQPDLDFSSAIPSCDYAFGTAVAPFRYVCPAIAVNDAGLALDASPVDDYLTSGSDPACAIGAYPALGTIPTVAVGEPFGLVYDEGPTGDASAATLPAEPAVPALATSTAGGWVLTQPGYLGFLAWQGSSVIDLTHVLARDIAALGLFSSLTGGPPLNSLPDSGMVAYEAIAGIPARVLAYPQADDGTLLGGTIACTFVSSDPSLLAVTSKGVIAQVNPVADGDVVLTATCAGMQAMATVHITGTPPVLDAAGPDGPEDAGALDVADVGAEQ